jgi:hypothetical protein
MIIKRNVNKGLSDSINKTGRFFSLLRCEGAVRISLFLSGKKVLNSELSQGMSLENIVFDSLELESSTTQIVTLWMSDYKLDKEPVASYIATLRGREKAIGAGVVKMLDYDPQRHLATITADKDIYIGGDNMEVDEGGSVINGYLHKAGEKAQIRPYGEVYCWWSDKVGLDFDFSIDVIKRITPNNKYTVTRANLESMGFSYIDILVPPELHNVPFDLKLVSKQLVEGNISTDIYVLATEGDPASQKLTVFDLGGGSGNFAPTQDWIDDITLSSGYHRLFVCESSFEHDGIPDGTDSDMGLVSMGSPSPLLSPVAILNILEERS